MFVAYLLCSVCVAIGFVLRFGLWFSLLFLGLTVVIPQLLSISLFKLHREMRVLLAVENATHYNLLGINLISERNGLRIEVNCLFAGGGVWVPVGNL
jgi:hypothetical protein